MCVLLCVLVACLCAVGTGAVRVSGALHCAVRVRVGVGSVCALMLGVVWVCRGDVCPPQSTNVCSAHRSVQALCSTGVFGSGRVREGRRSQGTRVGACSVRAVACSAGARAACIARRTMGVRFGFTFF